TAVQKVTSTLQIPSKSVSEVAILRYGKRQPAGDDKLPSIILIMEVSVTTVLAFCSPLVEARRIKPKNGEDSWLFSQSQIADGILRADRLAGKDVLTSGSNSVIRP